MNVVTETIIRLGKRRLVNAIIVFTFLHLCVAVLTLILLNCKNKFRVYADFHKKNLRYFISGGLIFDDEILSYLAKLTTFSDSSAALSSGSEESFLPVA